MIHGAPSRWIGRGRVGSCLHSPPRSWASTRCYCNSWGASPCANAGFGLWTGAAWASDTPQDLAAPYSSTHVIHGAALCGLLRLLAGRLAVSRRLILAMLVEVGWELLENTPAVINRYRATTASLDYTG